MKVCLLISIFLLFTTKKIFKYIKAAVKNFFDVFNQELGELENYTEIDVSEMNNMCLGAVCGIGHSGFYSGKFSVKPDSGLFLKIYKARFSKAGALYIYIFIYNQRNRFLVTQFGVAFQQGTDEFIIMKLSSQIEQVFCSKSDRKRKFLALAENIYKSHAVGYKLPTKNGEWLDINFDYKDYDSELREENVVINPFLNENDFTGEKKFTLITQQGKEIGASATYDESMLVQLKLDPAKQDRDIKEMFTLETKEGFIMNFNFTWRGGELASVRVEPQVHPFAGVGYIECYGQEN
jgi:hypothetical protein